MYHNNEISIINLSRLQCIVSVSVLVSANNFSTNTGIGNIGKKWYRSISSRYTHTHAHAHTFTKKLSVNQVHPLSAVGHAPGLKYWQAKVIAIESKEILFIRSTMYVVVSFAIIKKQKLCVKFLCDKYKYACNHSKNENVTFNV